ncbi:hypothetical protein MJO29_011204 [Puccinia striiformis f. sp. tritici]|nr:hypothetical protein MJO29_011204 [Puccinia striiformis f. sp. tritici]
MPPVYKQLAINSHRAIPAPPPLCQQATHAPRDTALDLTQVPPVDQCQGCQQKNEPNQTQDPINSSTNSESNDTADSEPDPDVDESIEPREEQLEIEYPDDQTLQEPYPNSNTDENASQQASNVDAQELEERSDNPESDYCNNPNNEDLVSEHLNDNATDPPHSNPDEYAVEEDETHNQSNLIIDVANSENNNQSSFTPYLGYIAEEQEPTPLQPNATPTAPMDPDTSDYLNNHYEHQPADQSDPAIDSSPVTQHTAPYQPAEGAYKPVSASYHPVPFPYQHIPISYKHFQNPYCQPYAQPQLHSPSHSPPASIESQYPSHFSPVTWFPAPMFTHPPNYSHYQYHPRPHSHFPDAVSNNINHDPETTSSDYNNHLQQDYEHHHEDNHIDNHHQYDNHTHQYHNHSPDDQFEHQQAGYNSYHDDGNDFVYDDSGDYNSHDDYSDTDSFIFP